MIPGMKQTDPQFKLRLPKSLKEKIDAAALEADRTVTAEIVSRLERTFDAAPSTEEFADLLRQLQYDVQVERTNKLIVKRRLTELAQDALELLNAAGDAAGDIAGSIQPKIENALTKHLTSLEERDQAVTETESLMMAIVQLQETLEAAGFKPDPNPAPTSVKDMKEAYAQASRSMKESTEALGKKLREALEAQPSIHAEERNKPKGPQPSPNLKRRMNLRGSRS
ncbi:Arc-like DNA binding domain protein [compost metagenome]